MPTFIRYIGIDYSGAETPSVYPIEAQAQAEKHVRWEVALLDDQLYRKLLTAVHA
jgi:hypothetical protein